MYGDRDKIQQMQIKRKQGEKKKEETRKRTYK